MGLVGLHLEAALADCGVSEGVALPPCEGVEAPACFESGDKVRLFKLEASTQAKTGVFFKEPSTDCAPAHACEWGLQILSFYAIDNDSYLKGACVLLAQIVV